MRWKLSLSYAGIALLTASVLGGILIAVLTSYFNSAEDMYLQAAGIRVSRELAGVGGLSGDPREVAILALTTQTRVRVYDSTGKLVADSGSPPEIDPGTLARTPDSDSGPLRLRVRLPAPLGNGFFGHARENGPRSDRSLRIPLATDDGSVVGAVVLSDGPASGSDVIAGVTQGFGLAALAAVLFSAVAGYLVAERVSGPIVALTSTTEKMAEGDLQARSAVAGDDEVGRLSASFNHMAERIENTVTALRRFVADAAHELGTPLTALQADLELAESSASTDDELRFVQRALAQARRLEDLSANLLRLSRLEAGETAVAEEPSDVAAIAHAAADAAASRAEQAGLALEMHVADGPLLVIADPGKLALVVDNLLDNAIKFTPDGGRIEIKAERDGAEALVSVTDTGIGIPEAQQAEVFERFFRARNVPAYAGSGLGLAIVKATVDRMGGSISFDSSEAGTRFDVRLPLA